ncbi:MAG: acyl-CoA mutase large subunit family protein [Alphaproteobacteria bacterium]|jgi:methylmalonyl-CoA mutase N-terminal domain/subunit|nr:acyl-CoA mutase large subunit family protein [Alphaproteobacteria bacterium]MDP6563309.1 acyl-CoA mutase large subunit family protein [Alphaproteobacteria bacterium]
MHDEATLNLSQELAEQREAAYQKIVDRFGNNAPAKARQPETNSGLPIKTAYFPHDVEGIDYEQIGAPGQYPFTRGNLAAQYQVMNWANQPVIGYGLPEHTRDRMDHLAAQGMIGYFGQRFYNLVYDLVSHEGIDPDHPAARGHIGRSGMAVYSVADMERLFHDMDLTKMNVIHISYYQVVPALAQYIAYGQRQGLTPSDLRGNSMNWYHQSAYVGMSAFPPSSGLKLAVELVNYCTEHMPRWNTTNFFGYGAEEAGATAVQEVALMLAFGIDLVRACTQSGMAADQALPRFGFQIAQSNDFFEEVCKIRALRRIWATTMHERFEAQDPRSMHVRIHTHTSGASLTAQQPLVNLIRTTLHAFGAALSGTQAMEVSAYDEALAIPTEDAATLALRVQQVIQEETNITSVSDPLAGSYYVESLTDQIAKAALEMVAEIESMGGYVAAHESGWIRQQIEASAAQWREDVNQGKRRIVGLNCYEAGEEQQATTFKIDEEVERVAIERVQAHRANRDAAKYEKAMAAFAESAQAFAEAEIADLRQHRLMETAIEAAQADATTGEMMGVMKEALGWGPPH